MSKETETPICDAAEIKVQLGNKYVGTGQVPIEDARRLERKNAELRDALKELREAEIAYEQLRHTSVGEPVESARERYRDAQADADAALKD